MEWISVKDRLPEDKYYPPVICGHCVDKWTDSAFLNGYGGFTNCENIDIYPTHWMNLPEPPKE